MSVQTIEKKINVLKEADEIFTFIAELIVSIKKGEGITEIVTENLNGLISAIGGFDKLPDEIKNENFYDTAGLGLAKITKSLIG